MKGPHKKNNVIFAH